MPIAGQLTAKADRLSNVIAAGLAESVTHAGQLAGYNHRESASRALRTATVQRAIEVKRAAQRDTARSIRQSAQRKLAVAVEHEEDAGRLTGIAVGMSQVEERIGVEDDSHAIGPRERLRATAEILRWIAHGARLAGSMTPRIELCLSAAARCESIAASIITG